VGELGGNGAEKTDGSRNTRSYDYHAGRKENYCEKKRDKKRGGEKREKDWMRRTWCSASLRCKKGGVKTSGEVGNVEGKGEGKVQRKEGK